MTRKTNIQKIILILPDLRIGGVQKMFINMAQWYTNHGFDVTLVTLTSPTVTGQISVSQDIKMITLPGARVRGNILKLVHTMKTTRPDLIISGLSYINILAILAMKWARLKDTKILVSERAYHSINANIVVKHYRIEKWLMRVLYPLSSKVIAISYGVEKDIIQSIRIKRDHVETIYNPVVTKDFKKQLKEKNIAELPKGKIIMACGRLVPVKDYPTLIRAFAKSYKKDSTLRLVILGDGPERQKLEDMCHDLGIEDQVTFFGFIDNALPYMKRADLFVQSSLAEGFGNVIVEALYCGTPVIATNGSGGVREILDDGQYGTLIPVGDDNALSRGIINNLSVRHNPERLRARAMEFSDEKVCPRFLSIAEKA